LGYESKADSCVEVKRAKGLAPILNWGYKSTRVNRLVLKKHKKRWSEQQKIDREEEHLKEKFALKRKWGR